MGNAFASALNFSSNPKIGKQKKRTSGNFDPKFSSIMKIRD